MDLIGDMLMQTLPAVSGGQVEAVQLRPRMHQRWSRLPLVGQSPHMQLADRLTGRLWDYPRWLVPRVQDFDVFHVVDHSYAHVMRVLPADRTVVTCNDVDAMTAALPSTSSIGPEGLLAKSVLDGVSRAAHVACISEATRTQLVASGRVAVARTSVTYLGVHPSCTPSSNGTPSTTAEVLHVGSTIPRKRIDVLIEIFAGARQKMPRLRLVRVGGPLTRRTARFCKPSRRARRHRRDAHARSRRACAISTDARRSSCSRPIAKASGFRSSRRWRAARPSWRAPYRRFAKIGGDAGDLLRTG